MKNTGIVRKVDALGRVVIPKETRRILGLEEGTAMEIFINNDSIILMKYQSLRSCVFCNEAADVTYFKGKCVCGNCLDTLKVHQKLAAQGAA